MLTTPQRRLQNVKALINSCSKCPFSWQNCKQQKKHGMCIYTKDGRIYGNIGLMEVAADYDTAAWCTDEITISGAPQ